MPNGPDDTNDMFDPTRSAMTVRHGLRGGDPDFRSAILGLNRYWLEYLRATVHGDPERPSRTPDGLEVYYSPMGRAHALYYTQVCGRALNCDDPDERERACARRTWAETDWDALWASCVRNGKL